MSLYIAGGRGYGAFRNIWIPGDPGQPNHADSKQELLDWCPRPEPRPCSNAECRNFSEVYAHAPGGRWQWANQNFCRRCFDLRRAHGLEFPELVAMWEAQDRRCCGPGCSRMLTDPRLVTKGRRASLVHPDGSWTIRIDHDHKVCPQGRHSCERCRRGLVCNSCNCHKLAITSTGFWTLPEGGGDLRRWLEFIGPEGRDRLRAGLIQFPEQPVRRAPRRRPHGEGEVIPLFDVS